MAKPEPNIKDRDNEDWCANVCNLSPGQRKDCGVQKICPKTKGDSGHDEDPDIPVASKSDTKSE